MGNLVVAFAFVLAIFGAIAIPTAYLIHWKLGAEDLNAWGTYFMGLGTVAISATAIVAAAQGLHEFRGKMSQERLAADRDKAMWLFQLYEKLFEQDQYKDIRRQIDNEDTAEIKRLIAKDRKKEAFERFEAIYFDKFTDYLNFFEMVAHLKEAGQLTEPDVRATFDYYLNLLTKQRNPEIREYLKKEGFESLDKLLLGYEG